MLISDKFDIFQNFQTSPIPQTSFWTGTFFASNKINEEWGILQKINKRGVWNFDSSVSQFWNLIVIHKNSEIVFFKSHEQTVYKLRQL